MSSFIILICVLAAAGGAFLYFRRTKNTPVQSSSDDSYVVRSDAEKNTTLDVGIAVPVTETAMDVQVKDTDAVTNNQEELAKADKKPRAKKTKVPNDADSTPAPATTKPKRKKKE